jgi:5,10-methylenetetrahydromethanopterin reductase
VVYGEIAVAFQRHQRNAKWFPDSPLNFRDVWATLGAVATSTDRIGLAVSVTNFASRHPSVTASAAVTIAEAAPDRFVLGLGAGDSAIGHSGLGYATTGQLRRGLADLRQWMAGEPMGSDGAQVHLRHGG